MLARCTSAKRAAVSPSNRLLDQTLLQPNPQIPSHDLHDVLGFERRSSRKKSAHQRRLRRRTSRRRNLPKRRLDFQNAEPLSRARRKHFSRDRPQISMPPVSRRQFVRTLSRETPPQSAKATARRPAAWSPPRPETPAPKETPPTPPPRPETRAQVQNTRPRFLSSAASWSAILGGSCRAIALLASSPRHNRPCMKIWSFPRKIRDVFATMRKLGQSPPRASEIWALQLKLPRFHLPLAQPNPKRPATVCYPKACVASASGASNTRAFLPKLRQVSHRRAASPRP